MSAAYRSAIAILVASSIAIPPTAFANDLTVVQNDLAAIKNLSKVSNEAETEILSSLAVEQDPQDADVALLTQANQTQVAVPSDPSEPVIIDAASVDAVTVELPFAEKADFAEKVTSGVTSFDNQNSTSTAVIPKSDGSVQFINTIYSVDGPTRFPYTIEVPPDRRMEFMPNGAVAIFDAQNQFWGGVAPAWAKDSNGRDVPTRYILTENGITQVVDHDSSFSYPVMADPWLGKDLFSRTWYGTKKNQLTVQAKKSIWGQVWHDPSVTGQAIFLNAGWNELKKKRPKVTQKKTLHQQYQCHVAGGYLNFAGSEWNLEKYRPTRTRHWSYGVVKHRCNWTTASVL